MTGAGGPGEGESTGPADPARRIQRSIGLKRIVWAMLLAVAVYAGFAVWQGVGKLGDQLARFGWWAFALACALALANYLLRWLKWEFYLARLGVRGVPRTDSLLIFLSGFVLTVTPGKVGEVFKSVLLHERYGVPVARTAPVVVAERVTDVLAIAILIAVGSVRLSGGLVWAAIGAGAVGAVVFVVSHRRLSTSLIERFERLPGPLGRIGPRLHLAYDSLATLVRPGHLAWPTALSVGAWALECLALWIILRGLGQTTGVGLATFFYATSTLAGALVPIPGGLGVTEASLEEQMQQIGGVGPAASTAAMILVRFATLWFAVLVGFVALSVLGRRRGRRGDGAATRSLTSPHADRATAGPR